MNYIKKYIDKENYVCFEFENGHVYDFEKKRLMKNAGGWIAHLRDKVWFDKDAERFLKEISGFTGGENEIKHGNI